MKERERDLLNKWLDDEQIFTPRMRVEVIIALELERIAEAMELRNIRTTPEEP